MLSIPIIPDSILIYGYDPEIYSGFSGSLSKPAQILVKKFLQE